MNARNYTKAELIAIVEEKVAMINALQRELSVARANVANVAKPEPTPEPTPVNILFTSLDRAYAYKAYEQLKRSGKQAHYEPMNVRRNGRLETVFNVVIH